MKNFFSNLRRKSVYLSGLIIATITGTLISATVMAAIPDSNGDIHSCINKLTGLLKIIDDSSQSCNATSENSLNWQSSAQAKMAFLHVNQSDGSIDSGYSTNITTYSWHQDVDLGYWACVKVAFTPKFVNVGPGVSINNVAISSQVNGNDALDQYCGSHTTYNAVLMNVGTPGEPSINTISSTYYVMFQG